MYKIITIARQHGSGGREIGRRVAEELGIPFYDKEIIERAANESSISKGILENSDIGDVGSLLYKISESLASEVRHDLSMDDKVYLAQRAAILGIATKGSCVIVGRGACEVLKDKFKVLRVFVYADIETRMKRVVEQYGEPNINVEKRIRQIDKKRRAYYQFYEKKENFWTEHFDLCINSGKMGIDKAVQLICEAYRG